MSGLFKKKCISVVGSSDSVYKNDWINNAVKVLSDIVEEEKIGSNYRRKIKDSALYEFLINFLIENDQLPTVAVCAKSFGTANNAIHERLTRFESKGWLARNRLNNFMFPRKVKTLKK